MQRKHRRQRRRKRTCQNVHFHSQGSISQTSQRYLRFCSKIPSTTTAKAQSHSCCFSSDYYDIGCRISYGESEQVEVLLTPGSYSSRSMSWKHHFRLLSNKSLKCPPNSYREMSEDMPSMDNNNENDHSSYGDHDAMNEYLYDYLCDDDVVVVVGTDDEFYDDVFLPSSEREFCVKSPLLITTPACINSDEEMLARIQEAPQLPAGIESLSQSGLDHSSPAQGQTEDWLDNFWDFVEEDDHNRIINQTITPPSSKSNSSKPETPTDLQENGLSLHNNNNHISATATAATATTPAAAITDKSGQNIRTTSRTSSPVLSSLNNKKSTPAPSPAVASHLSEKKQQNKLHNTSSSSPSTSTSNASRKSLLHKQHQQLSDDVVVIPSAEPAAADELQQLKLLNRHSCNGALNYEAFEQQQLQLQQLQQQSAHQTKSTEALGVLLQYLVYDLDAFACPSLRSENAKTKDKLKKTLLLLDEAKSSCSELEDQLCDKDAYYMQRENELQALHRCELDKARSNFEEFEIAAKQQISTLQSQLESTEAEHRKNFDSYRSEMEKKLSEKLDQIRSKEERESVLQQRLQDLEISEEKLRERLTQTEESCSKRLQQSAESELELMERIKSLTKELDRLKSQKESNERDLKDKLNLSNDEIAILRTTRRSLNESGVCSPRNTSSCSAVGNMELSRLQNEIESLRCVLELKQKEISKLTKQNEELLRDADEKLTLQGKISLLESKNEMLLSEMEIKSEKEKEYLRQIDEIQKAFNHETVKRTRLSYDNEALQWQLKQRSEQLHLVETKLHELSSHEMSSTSITNRSSSNGSALNTSLHMDDISPPSSPVIKGVIEKTDSVSWVLEMDDETPEAAATKMVKRAGSFRSVERSSSMRKQLSVSANAGQTFNNSLLDTTGPNPLSQSMSATSVIREHSKVETSEFNNRLHPRIRSKSVSVKGCEALQQKQKSSSKLSRQLSSGSSRKSLDPADFKEPLTSSSPFSIRPRTSTLKIDNEQNEDVLFRRGSAKLITCDTSALNKGERLEMRSLPSLPSVQDLKVIKKCQEIQESAGEAMVSGTNSEDESCSASSDDVVSTASSSGNSDTTNSSNQLKNSRMSIEDVLLMEKMNSLSGTPMEVSWSEDADGLANSSTL